MSGESAEPSEPERAPSGRREPWYADGLRFECTACGRCCTNHGDGFSYVYATRAERQAIARHLGVSLSRFDEEYCRRDRGWHVFKDAGDACIFLGKDGRCGIYALRPKQCRTFPFWPELLVDEATWEKDVASFCPGAGQGEVHDLAAIRAAMKASR